MLIAGALASLVSEAEVTETQMVVRAATQRPVKIPLGLSNRVIVDAGEARSQYLQAIIVDGIET